LRAAHAESPGTAILETGLPKGGSSMSAHVYKKIEVVGSSKNSVEDAIQNAISTAAKSLNHLDWFEVQEVRGDIKNGSVDYYQVTLKVGFRLNE
jgi:flavin-binding protein dodecin